MTTYNTGNPIGSTDPRDLYDNAQNLDTAMHTAATTWADRLGNSRPSWAGATGYQSLGDYAAGIQVTTYNQVIRAAGEYWRAAAGTALPYTTTGAGMPESGKFVSVGDAILRADLVDGDGSSLVGFQQAGAGAVVRTAQDKMREVVSVKDFGAVGDGATDDTAAIQAALNYVHGLGGGSVRLSRSGAPYCIADTLTIGNDVHLICDEWLKIIADTTYDCAVTGIPGAGGWRISGGLKVDANSVPAQGGLYIRRNNVDVQVDSVECINAVHDKTTKGGRALTIEAGVAYGLYGTRRTQIGKVIARNCYNAVTIAGGATAEDTNFIIGDVTAENCETLILAFGNKLGFPHDGTEMQGIIHNVSGRNCGKSTTYARGHGAISMDRGCNVLISNVSLVNDATYGSIGAAVMGDFFNVHILNFMFEGDCTRLIFFGRFAEADTIADDIFETEKSKFQISHLGTCTDTMISSLSADSKVRTSEIDLAVDTVTSGNTMASQMAWKTTTWARIYSRTANAVIHGICSQIGVKPIASYAGLNQSFSDFLQGAATYDPGSIAAGSGVTTTITVAGAAVGDFVEAAFSLDINSLTVTAWVSAPNTVSVRFQNGTAAPIDLVSGTLRVRVRKR